MKISYQNAAEWLLGGTAPLVWLFANASKQKFPESASLTQSEYKRCKQSRLDRWIVVCSDSELSTTLVDSH